MRIAIIFIISLFTFVGVSAQQLQFDKTIHDFGKVSLSKDYSCQFTLTNTSDQPIVILSVKVNCKCTVPRWDKSPIMTDQSRTINIKFDPKERGVFYKKLSIITSEGNYEVYVKGEVE